MADPENNNEETTPPPTEEERQVETVNDPTPEPEPESEPESSQPDVSARLDALEKEFAALKAMMDTLGYNDAADAHDNDDDDDHDGVADSIENLFD